MSIAGCVPFSLFGTRKSRTFLMNGKFEELDAEVASA